MIYSLFLDESGIESYTDPQLYVVAGCIIDRDYVNNTVIPQIKSLKNTYFANENIIFHFTEMKAKRKAFSCLNNPTVRNNFWNDYLTLLESFNFCIVSAVVDKHEMQSRYQYPQAAKRVALPVIYENYVHFLKNNDSIGKVFVEQVNDKENERIHVQYHLLMANGTARLSREGFRKHINGLKFHEKTHNIIGLQIADAIAFIINAYFDGRIRSGSTPDLIRLWNIIEAKLYDGGMAIPSRYGLQRLP